MGNRPNPRSGDETIITTNAPADYAYLGLRMATDAEPGAGALPGLLTALQAARVNLHSLSRATCHS